MFGIHKLGYLPQSWGIYNVLIESKARVVDRFLRNPLNCADFSKSGESGIRTRLKSVFCAVFMRILGKRSHAFSHVLGTKKEPTTTY